MEMTKVQSVTITGLHPNAFRSGETAEVIGLVFITMKPTQPGEKGCIRLNYHVRFEDGCTDYIPAFEAEKPDVYRLWVKGR